MSKGVIMEYRVKIGFQTYVISAIISWTGETPDEIAYYLTWIFIVKKQYVLLLPNVYIRSNCLFFAMSWVTELFPQSLNLTIDWHYTMAWLPASLFKITQALIDMRDNIMRTVRLWKETLCNNGENKAWFCNFKLL